MFYNLYLTVRKAHSIFFNTHSSQTKAAVLQPKHEGTLKTNCATGLEQTCVCEWMLVTATAST